MKLIRNSLNNLVAIVDSEDIVDIHNYSTSTNTTTLTIPAINNKDINFVNYGAVAWTLAPDLNEGLTINKSTSSITVNAGKSVSLRYDSLAKNFIIAGSSESTGGGGGSFNPTIDTIGDITAIDSAILDNDTVTVALGKTQGQINNKQDKADYISITQSADITLPDYSAPEKATDGTSKIWTIQADPTHTFAVPVAWRKKNNLSFYNGITNIIKSEAIDGIVYYDIYNTEATITDVTAPILLALSSSYSGAAVYAIYNEPLAGSLAGYTISGGITIASTNIIGNIVEFNLTTALTASIAYTMSGSGITDLFGNAAAALSASAIVNNTVTNVNSLLGQSGGAFGLLTATGVSKAILAGGAGGTDLPWTISALVMLNVSGSTNFLVFGAARFGSIGTVPFTQAALTGAVYIIRNSGGSMSVGTWYHLVATYDGSKTGAGLNFYLNGVLANGSTSTVGGYTGGSAAGDITILPLTINPNQIDEISVWNRVLTGAEITELFNSGLTKDVRSTSMYIADNTDLLYYLKADGNITDLSLSPLTLTGTPNYSTNIRP